MKHKQFDALAVIAFCMLLPACSRAFGSSGVGRTANETRPSSESRIYDTRAHRFLEMPAFISRITQADIVFFGEQHDDPATHRAELAILAAAGSRRSNVVVSVEMFERDVQPVVNAYMAGQITDSVFNATSRPWPNYVTDYRPLIELARANGWPVVAANVPRRLASLVGKSGLKDVSTFDQATRPLVAADLQCPHDKYYDLFADAMTDHSAGAPAASDTRAALDMTNRFYDAQCVKDETMAESIVTAFDRAGSDAFLLHFNGAFHSNMGLGTVSRVKRRKPGARVVVITAVPVDNVATADAAAFADLGDYVLLTPKPPKK